MQGWDVHIDYRGGGEETVSGVRANTADMAIHVALLCRRSPRPPARVVAMLAQKGEGEAA